PIVTLGLALANQSITITNCGKTHTLVTTNTNQVWGYGDNKHGSLGRNKQDSIIMAALANFTPNANQNVMYALASKQFSLILVTPPVIVTSTPTFIPTPTLAPSPTITQTPTLVPTPTVTPALGQTPTSTNLLTSTPTNLITSTPISTIVQTTPITINPSNVFTTTAPSITPTPTIGQTLPSTSTPTVTLISTSSVTPTLIPTNAITPTPTRTTPPPSPQTTTTTSPPVTTTSPPSTTTTTIPVSVVTTTTGNIPTTLPDTVLIYSNNNGADSSSAVISLSTSTTSLESIINNVQSVSLSFNVVGYTQAGQVAVQVFSDGKLISSKIVDINRDGSYVVNVTDLLKSALGKRSSGGDITFGIQSISPGISVFVQQGSTSLVVTNNVVSGGVRMGLNLFVIGTCILISLLCVH
ncbi:hypothetical protein AKO1_015200, partial [Acrasis kona]